MLATAISVGRERDVRGGDAGAARDRDAARGARARPLRPLVAGGLQPVARLVDRPVLEPLHRVVDGGAQPIALVRLLGEPRVHRPQVDEHRDLRAQHPRVERLGDVVHRARLVAAEGQVRVVVHRGEEQDRDVPGALALLDVPRGLEAVHARHVRVEQDHRVVLDEQPLEGVLAAGDRRRSRPAGPPGSPAAPAGSPAGRRRPAPGPTAGSSLRLHAGEPGRGGPAGATQVAMSASSSSRSTGLVTYSVAPAARLDSRSPGIAFAVRNTTGSSRPCGSARIGRVVSLPSRSGIIASISTTSTSGCSVSSRIPLGAVVGVEHGEPVQLQRAGQREDVAHVVVDDEHGGAGELRAPPGHRIADGCRAGSAWPRRAAPAPARPGRDRLGDAPLRHPRWPRRPPAAAPRAAAA